MFGIGTHLKSTTNILRHEWIIGHGEGHIEFTLINITDKKEKNQSELVIFPSDTKVSQPYGTNG